MILTIYILGVVITFVALCIADRQGKLILVYPDFGEGIFVFVFSLLWPLIVVVLIKYYLKRIEE